MGTAYSNWCARAWTPKNASATRQYRARVDSYLSTYDTYCTITSTLYLELTRTVSHSGYNWWAVNGASGTAKSVFEDSKIYYCYSWTTGAINRGHTNGSTYTQGAISASSSSGSNTWNGEWVYATEYYTIPARASWAVTYDANDGSGRTATQTKWHSENLTLLPSDYWTREGYGFLGWNKNANGTGDWVTPGSTYSTNAGLGPLYAIWQAPPTGDITVTSSAPYYTEKPSFDVTVSNVVVDTGTRSDATVSNITLNLGAQSDIVSTANNGQYRLSITPETAGIYEPTIKITDTLTASTTYNLLTEEVISEPITVKQYVNPVLTLEVQRTKNTGEIDETSGNYCVIEATTVFKDDAYKLQPPIVTYAQSGSEPQSPIYLTWYTRRNIDGTIDLNSEVDWSAEIGENQRILTDATIYGLMLDPLDTLHSYTISVTPRDNRSNGTMKTASVAVAVYPIDFLAGGRGVAIGKVAEEENFDSAMEAWFRDVIYLVVDGNASTLSDDSDVLLDAYIAHGLNSAYWGITEHGWLSGGGEE